MLLFWPCVWGLTIASDLNNNINQYFFYILLFFSGAVLMRSAGCIVNDILDKEFDAKLKFVAPKGTEEGGAVQFKIEAELALDDDTFVRAGYSANGALVVNSKTDVMVIPEAVLQFDRKTQKPYVEIEISDQNFERREIETGLSDGIKVEILSGVEMTDNIKIWNKTEPLKIEPEESAFDQFEDR